MVKYIKDNRLGILGTFFALTGLFLGVGTAGGLEINTMPLVNGVVYFTLSILFTIVGVAFIKGQSLIDEWRKGE